MPRSAASWRRIALTRRSSELLAARPGVDERHEAEADRELERVDADLGHRFVRLGQRRLAAARAGGVGVGGARQPVAHDPGDRAEDPRDQQEGKLRQAGDQREQADRAGGDERRLALTEDLAGDVRAEVAVGGGAGDDDAGGDRDQQRRDLRGETVADGQQRVLVGGFAEAEVALEHADDDPADEVDAGDDQRRHGVAFDELGGAVHGAVEVGLARDVRASLARLLVGDQAGVEIGVDRHLLAGHRVEREARADLGDAPGAVGDDDELDHDEDQEDHEADDDVAADDEFAEGLDDAAGVAGGEDQARHRHVDREPEHRGQQQQARERREVERLAEVHRGRDDRERAGDVERDQQAQQRRGQRHDEHRHDHHDRHGREQVCVAQQPAHAGAAHDAILLLASAVRPASR